ncbi:MAG: phosphate regulon sensor histidine kinase PhoR, partial [Oceanobacter sp.]
RTSLLPRTLGLWGVIFADTQRLQQRSFKDKQRLQAIINRIQDSTAALKDSVLMVDASGALEFWNKSAQKNLGLQYPVDIGQPITHLIRNPEFRRYFEAADYNEPLTIASPISPKVFLQFNVTLFGRKDRLIVVHDVTRLKQLEQMRKDFVANVSHELRTPLTVITGYVETLQMAADSLPPRWGRILQQMGDQSRRMDNLIRDLLMLSTLETEKGNQPETIELRPLLEAILSDARALSGGHHEILLEMNEEVTISGYYSELRSALSNLVFNAVKYSPEGGKIQLIWKSSAEEGRFSVSDQGIGISEHHIPRLTERFYRADPSRSKETGGTGLGLAIAKHVLLRHKAHMEIQSQENVGSTFTCVFPSSQLSITKQS